MDVSFTNVLEGARQYFQGLPVPSTGDTAASTEHPIAISSASSSLPTSTGQQHDHATTSSSARPSSATAIPNPAASGQQETNNRYGSDVRSGESNGGAAASSSASFWSPQVEPYPPQPTRVEVPDTRPGDESSTLEPSSSSGPITLTEMQPSNHRATSSPSSSTGYAQKQSSVVALYTDNRHQQPCSVAAATSSSPNLHQMQTPQQLNHSPAPVYQHLTTAARTPYSASERHPTSHSGTYQSGNDRPSQPSAPIVTQRTQYYPRYHHPDITKSAPVPFSQNSIYQSASVASASSTSVQQPSTRSTPTEQSPAPHHGSAQDHPSQQDPSQQRVPPPSSYGSSVPLPSPVGSAIYGSSTVPSRYHRSAAGPQQQASQQNCIGSASSGESRSSQHNSDGYMGHLPSAASSPSCSSSTACSPRHPGGGAGSNHIPSSASLGLPPHAAPLHHNPHQSSQQQQQQHSQHQHPSRLSGPLHSGVSSMSSVGGSVGSNSYSGRMVLPHGGPSSSTSSSSSSSSASSNHSHQMPPPAAIGTYHPVASPHHEPPHHATPSPHRQSPHVAGLHNPHASSPHHAISPHNTFQPRSPTYPPPPPPARSTSHTYNLPATSQHYQSSGAGAGYPANPYAPPQPQSSYHSFQKSSQPPQSQPGTYYPQSKRSHGQAYVQPQTLAAPPGPPPPPPPPQASCSVSGSAGSYQASKPITYNGTEPKRAANPSEMGGVSYGCYRTGSAAPTMQRNASTHNLPPIAAVASYHSNRRETVGKAQSMQRQRMHSSGSSAAAATAKVSAVTSPTSSMIGGPQRIGDYPGTPPGPMNHAIPVNGRTTGVSSGNPSSSYRRYAIQQQCTAGYSTYAMTIAPSHHGSTSSTSTTVTSIEASGARASVPPIAIQAYQSSDAPGARIEPPYHHHRHPPPRVSEEYGYKEHSYQNCSSSTGQPPTAAAATVATSSQISNGVRKRESPLDLSVKTVKTSADSTAQDDLEMISAEKHVTSSSLISSRSNGTRPTMLPPVGQSPGSLPPPPPPTASYGTYDARVSTNGTRGGSSSSSAARTSTPQTVCAPKVDFLPDFNSTPLSPYHEQISQEGASRRSGPQHVYAAHPQQPPPLSSQHATNPTPLPHMSTFKKSSLPSASIYDGVAAPPPAPPPPTSYLSSGGEPPASRTPSRYPPAQVLEPARMSSATLPLQDYPSDSAKYYHLEPKSKYGPQPPPTPPQRADRAGMLGKRPAPESTVYGGPVGKQPRLDTWRLAIDKQIQQRLSTARALHEQQKKQEMNNLPVPLPNGTLVTPGAYEQRSDSSGYSSSESARYQQAYCDKRTSYQEQKTTVRGTPSSYNHSMPGKPTHAMPPQQIITAASQMPPYSAPYRQTPQRVICPPSVPTSGQLPDQPSNTGADKRVLSLLRNSLENKQQKEEQLSGQQPILVNHSQPSFQNKVVAPVEPKTNVGRHNLSPFTAASLLERNSNTPPHYKFHMPRAVDSINQDAPRTLYGSRVNSSATLPGKEALLVPRAAESQIHRDKDDGLAAILLAAKIRTKAELKQVEGQFIGKSSVIPSQDASSTPKEFDSAASTSTPQSGSSAGSPPKLTREKTAALPPRRRLFSKTEEDNMLIAATVPVSAPVATVPSTVPARASGCRSSSETSVFDFRESDSEGEMPVLERQTLEGMRRDRKQLSKVQPPVPLNDAMCMGVTSSVDLVKIELKENDKINEVDPFWTATCDKFMEQLRTGDAAKKRGRKKKSEGAAASSKTEDVSNDSSKEVDGNPQAIVKVEEEEALDVESDARRDRDDGESTKDEGETRQSIKLELKTEAEIKKEAVEERISDDDSDEVPLIERTTRKKTKKEDSDCDEDEGICRKRRVVRRGSRIKLESSSGSESSSEESDSSAETGQTSSVADRLRARKRSVNNNTAENEGMKLRSRDATPHKGKPEKESKSSSSKNSAASPKIKPKPLFGDGSDFRPGWEEEVYVYKKSLRMPTRLITVSKPSRFHRLSTSLPDLDPGSPALSVSMDSSDVCLGRKRIVDSDTESNCSFSTTGFGAGSKIDDEEATSSTTVSCPPKATKNTTRLENNSIVDVLAQKVGTSTRDQRKKQREKLEKRSKVLRKGNNELELLPTPSLTPLLTTESTKPTKGKTPVKNNKSSKPIKVTDSFLLGYFRKETVNTFRDTFKNNHALPNEFSTFVLKSRTRTETRVLKKQATIREVFGEDRPASAPPMQNHDDTSQDDDSQNETRENNVGKARSLKQKVVSRLKNAGILRSHKAIVNAKCHLLIAKRRKDLLKSLADKKLQRATAKVTETAHKEAKDNRKVENNELEDDNNESEVPNKRKLKLRPGRRKFRSGFDYIRRKKKPLKKDESLPKERKRQVLSRPSPECVADIQTEIRTWVIKKGVGETILHRAARLGYTDVAAYCLEKLNSAPNPKDNAGYTPLHEACSKGHLEIAKLLLAYGANASESANGGIRPLHEAAENGATELVRLLLSYGADPLLATYSGQTPLMLAVDTEAYSILQQHLDDIQGRTCTPWFFAGPSSIFDPEETGYNPLDDPPLDSPEPELDEVEMEVSDVNLPVLFSLTNDPDKWVLLQDLMAALRIKSRDALLRQVNPKAHVGPPAIAHRDVMRELKLPDFLEQSRCCHLLSGGERINVRGSKVTLIKYNDKVKSLLNVERVLISLR